MAAPPRAGRLRSRGRRPSNARSAGGAGGGGGRAGAGPLAPVTAGHTRDFGPPLPAPPPTRRDSREPPSGAESRGPADPGGRGKRTWEGGRWFPGPARVVQRGGPRKSVLSPVGFTPARPARGVEGGGGGPGAEPRGRSLRAGSSAARVCAGAGRCQSRARSRWGRTAWGREQAEWGPGWARRLGARAGGWAPRGTGHSGRAGRGSGEPGGPGPRLSSGGGRAGAPGEFGPVRAGRCLGWRRSVGGRRRARPGARPPRNFPASGRRFQPPEGGPLS